MILATQSSGNKLIFAGNGASASTANHASLDFTKQGKVSSIVVNSFRRRAMAVSHNTVKCVLYFKRGVVDEKLC